MTLRGLFSKNSDNSEYSKSASTTTHPIQYFTLDIITLYSPIITLIHPTIHSSPPQFHTFPHNPPRFQRYHNTLYPHHTTLTHLVFPLTLPPPKHHQNPLIYSTRALVSPKQQYLPLHLYLTPSTLTSLSFNHSHNHSHNHSQPPHITPLTPLYSPTQYHSTISL